MAYVQDYMVGDGLVSNNILGDSLTTNGRQDEHRYWRAYKTNAGAPGGYHTELEVYSNGFDVTKEAPGAYSQSGFLAYSPTALYDNNTGTPAFHTDLSGPGSYLQIDFGYGKRVWINKWRFYSSGSVTAIWDIEYSDDATNWTKAATGLDCSGAAGWKEITW